MSKVHVQLIGLGSLAAFVLTLGGLARPALAQSETTVKVGDKVVAASAALGARYYALNCAACHGRAGASSIDYPRLSAQIPGYVAGELVAFRSGERENAVMHAVASVLTDQTIADLAAYLGSTPAAEPWASTNAALSAQGHEIFVNGRPGTGVSSCNGCHGAQGQGNAQANFPRIGGQTPSYVVERLEDLAREAATTKEQGPAATMAKIAAAMTPADRVAIAEYLKTLK